jgi:Asp-tRNA(Asn)/Glu-tRNA(Gln) amidotransferase A subunit family amidase
LRFRGTGSKSIHRSVPYDPPMTNSPWPGDACSLVDAFRAGKRSPLEELDATLAAIEASELNAFSYLDPEPARRAARQADTSLPFGGVPVGVKELDSVAGWPYTSASVPLKDQVAARDSTLVGRLRAAGAVLPGLTTSSEFGGVNLTRTNLNGATRNPWGLEHTPGGSTGGTASAVAGGLLTLGSGGDGGGSLRIPAGFTGLVGLKCTYGRFPKGPGMVVGSLTAVLGCLSRSVRDTARFLDVANGFDHRDPYSLARVDGWEAGLETHELEGRKVAIAPDLGVAIVHPEVVDLVVTGAEALVTDAGLEVVDVPVKLPELGYEWALSGLSEVLVELGDRYPECEPDLTLEIGFGLKIATEVYNLAARARIEAARTAMNEAMAEIFDQVDFVIAASNPDVAFAAEGPLPSEVGGVRTDLGNNGALTIPANVFGSPAISVPVGSSRGLPVGMQVLGRHHEEALLLDLGRLVERERPWPLVAPGSPR